MNNASLLDAILFADNKNLLIFISHNDPVYLNDTLKSELNNLLTWFAANRLSLNLSKTSFMVFKPPHKKQLFEFHVSINQQSIPRVSETMFLVGFVDEFSQLILFELCMDNSMILPYLYYCNLAWGGTYKSNLQKIVILQKRALRIVSNSTYDANTGRIFKKLELKFHDIHLLQLGLFMFSLRCLPSLPSSKTFSIWTAKSIIITLGMPSILFACYCAEQTPDSFQFISKVQCFIPFFEFCHNWFVLICIF